MGTKSYSDIEPYTVTSKSAKNQISLQAMMKKVEQYLPRSLYLNWMGKIRSKNFTKASNEFPLIDMLYEVTDAVMTNRRKNNITILADVKPYHIKLAVKLSSYNALKIYDKSLVRHLLDWRKIATNADRTENRQNYYVMAYIPYDGKLFPMHVKVWFTEKDIARISLSRMYVDMFGIEKTDFFIICLDGRKLEYDPTKRYDIECNPFKDSNVTIPDKDEEEPIEYEWEVF